MQLVCDLSDSSDCVAADFTIEPELHLSDI